MFKIHRPQQNEGALKKSIQKLFDHKKDIGTRLKHLKNVIGMLLLKLFVTLVMKSCNNFSETEFFQSFFQCIVNLEI